MARLITITYEQTPTDQTGHVPQWRLIGRLDWAEESPSPEMPHRIRLNANDKRG